MKIWIDMTQESHRNLDQERQSECSKDCPSGPYTNKYVVLSQLENTHIEAAQASLYTDTLQHAQSLYIQSYTNEYTQACCPTTSGIVVILDTEALALLQCFQHPISLNDVVHRLQYLSVTQIEAATNYFYHTGLLCKAHNSQSTPPSVDTEVLAAWLHVTNACNLSCDYCYIAKSNEHMQEDTAQQAIEAIFRSAVKHHFKSVRLQYAGGEASLQADHIIKLHDYALALAEKHNLDLSAYIMSNGVYLSTHVIGQLKSRNIGVMISLDGVGEANDRQRHFVNGRGSFMRIDRTITRLLEHDVYPSISVTVSSRNIAGMPELLKYILERNLQFSLNYYRENDFSAQLVDMQLDEELMITGMRKAFAMITEHIPHYSLLNSLIDKANLKSPHTRTCGVGQNYMVINHHGQVAKCQVEMKHTVTTIAVEDPLQFIRDDRDGVQGLTVDEKEGCRSCQWRNWCTGGCPALTYRLTGRYDIQSPNCHIYQALFPDVLRLEALRLLTYVAPITL